MKAFVERMLAKVFAQKAHDPNLDTMSAYERREAEALAAKPTGMRSPLAASFGQAQLDAQDAMAPSHVPMKDDLADHSAAARRAAEAANAHDGSHLRSEPVDHAETTLADIRDASHHEPPHSELADDTEEAHYAARRASEPADKGNQEAEQREEQRE